MYELWGSGGSPFKNNGDNTLNDRGNTRVELLGKSAEILHELTQPPYEKTIISWVSCTDEPSWAEECLSMFTTSDGVTTLNSIATHNQIFKANKREHFERLKKQTGIEFSDMIFFDNQSNNINDVSKLGVHSVLCPDGMLREIWTKGIESFQNKQVDK